MSATQRQPTQFSFVDVCPSSCCGDPDPCTLSTLELDAVLVVGLVVDQRAGALLDGVLRYFRKWHAFTQIARWQLGKVPPVVT